MVCLKERKKRNRKDVGIAKGGKSEMWNYWFRKLYPKWMHPHLCITDYRRHDRIRCQKFCSVMCFFSVPSFFFFFFVLVCNNMECAEEFPLIIFFELNNRQLKKYYISSGFQLTYFLTKIWLARSLYTMRCYAIAKGFHLWIRKPSVRINH